MAQVLRWCKMCGKRKPLSGFDTVKDRQRRFCSIDCYGEFKEHGYLGKKKQTSRKLNR